MLFIRMAIAVQANGSWATIQFRTPEVWFLVGWDRWTRRIPFLGWIDLEEVAWRKTAILKSAKTQARQAEDLMSRHDLSSRVRSGIKST